MPSADQMAADYLSFGSRVVGNSDLEELEGRLEKFNIFEAIGVVRQELRHSNFLAFLLEARGTIHHLTKIGGNEYREIIVVCFHRNRSHFLCVVITIIIPL